MSDGRKLLLPMAPSDQANHCSRAEELEGLAAVGDMACGEEMGKTCVCVCAGGGGARGAAQPSRRWENFQEVPKGHRSDLQGLSGSDDGVFNLPGKDRSVSADPKHHAGHPKALAKQTPEAIQGSLGRLNNA